ncbi:hypothetical protein ACF3NV_07740 [Moraxella atlantae]|uniref:hypothetical protein n=1 Tax=Faucicola atlantae TaxID=34059 RepID=UPI003752F97E
MSKRNQITPPAIKWFKQEYEAGRTIEEMSIDTGWSKQNVKRALAEAGIMYLSWYKTANENELLKFLYSKGITRLDQVEVKV